jgi:hypothetical protein
MEKLIINTGLHHFFLVDGVTRVDEKQIQGFTSPSGRQSFLLVESMAQLGAMHVRFITDFNAHAFLLGISNLQMTEAFPGQERTNITGTLNNRSTDSFLYTLTAEIAGSQSISGTFLFATIPYDDTFREDCLQHHYKKIFSCLQSVS